MILGYVDDVNDKIAGRLETEASNGLIDGLRTCTIGRSIIAVGLLGVFEALLQQHFGWQNVPADLDNALRGAGQDDLADRLTDNRDAINVLKHGRGRSYERLLSRGDALPFLIKGRGEPFFDEGDVSEVTRLVEADSQFIDASVAIITEIREVLGLL